ncbi:MAG: DUF3794 domain-containing protein [Ruminococcaceae bacterium]|nr:DUF3794 domain-containing protein [Oscillospiraceae bacterium]
MDCKVTGDTVLMYESVFEGTAEQPVDVEFTLPDYCPDVGRVLKCRATPIITGREVTAEGISVSGTARLEVLYSDGHGGQVRCCTHDTPFVTLLPSKGISGDAKVCAEARVDYINCRAVSQRRMDIHGAFTVKASAVCLRENQLKSSAEGAGVLARRQICDVSTALGHAQTAFAISESFELPESKPSVAAVVRSAADISVLDCKPIANKLIVKGSAELTVVYCTNDGVMERMSYSVPFSQFFDINGADDESCCDADISVSSVELALRTDPDGEYRRFSADIRCFADIRAYRNDTAAVITDAYSTRYELKLERRNMSFERYLGDSVRKARADGRLSFPGGITEVLDAWCEPVTCVCGSGGSVNGTVLLCAIIRNEDGGFEYGETTCAFECEAGEGGEDSFCRGRIAACGCDYSLSGRNDLELHGEARVRTAMYSRTQLPCVVELEPDESRPRSDADGPALVMYFACAGEELWDIAREHNASVSDIAADNGIADEPLCEDKLLLIARG